MFHSFYCASYTILLYIGNLIYLQVEKQVYWSNKKERPDSKSGFEPIGIEKGLDLKCVTLLGDCSKAKEKLGWKLEMSFDNLVQERG